MAGVGFALRTMIGRDSFLGPAQGYLYAALIACGPWLMTIACLAGLGVILGGRYDALSLDVFRSVLIYNFSLSLVFTGPVNMVATRYLADRFYERSVHAAPTVLVSVLAAALILGMVVGLLLYGVIFHLPRAVTLGAVMNLALVSGVWGVSIFLCALKEYVVYGTVFAMGLAIAFAATVGMALGVGPEYALMGFNLGLAVILFTIVARVLVEYPAKATWPGHFLAYFPRFWQLALSGLALNAGLWVDKWLMWFAPDAERVAGQIPFNANYDVAMFLVYLTIVPALTLMLVSFETGFFDRYTRYNGHIRGNAPLSTIQSAGTELGNFAFGELHRIMFFQGIVSALAYVYAPYWIPALGGAYIQIGLARLGLVGAFFHVSFLFICLVLSYFDQRGVNLSLQMLFMAANGLLTYASIHLGYAYYGSGYAIACLGVFLAGYLAMHRLFANLTYRTYVLGLRAT